MFISTIHAYSRRRHTKKYLKKHLKSRDNAKIASCKKTCYFLSFSSLYHNSKYNSWICNCKLSSYFFDKSDGWVEYEPYNSEKQAIKLGFSKIA